MSTTVSGRGLSALRSANRRRLVDVLQDRGESSRADLARMTGLSGTTVSSLVAELTGEGVVIEAGRDDRAAGRTGRPGRLVQLVGGRGLVVGVDLAHDVVRLAVCDLAGTVVAEHTEPLDADADGPDTLQRTGALVNELIESTGISRTRFMRLVLGLPGAVDTRTGHVVADRMPRWSGIDPRPALHASTGLAAIAENDADLCALGERDFGAARGLSDVVHVKASDGIGIGLLISGRLYRGAHGGAGEIGHVQVREHGDLCICGSRGCLESIAALPPVLAAMRVVHPDVRSADDLRHLVEAGDRVAVRAVTDAGALIGKVVADLCNVLAPQAVVVGGELAAGGPYLAGAVRDAIARYTTSRTAGSIAVLEGELGPRAAVLGAVAAAVEAELAS